MEEAEAFPEEEETKTTDAPSSTRRRNASTTHRATKRRHLAFAFLFGVVFASCFRRWWWYHHPASRSSPFFFPSSSSAHAKAADGLRVKSRRKKPPGRVDEEEDFDRGEKRDDESGEKEEEKKTLLRDDDTFACGAWSPSESFSSVSKDVDSLETHELLELSLRSARAAAYLFAKASWPAAMRLKRATFDRGKRVGLWMARFVMMHSSSRRGKYYEDEDAAEAGGDGAARASYARRGSFVSLARKGIACVLLFSFVRNGALVARKVLVRRFGAKWMMVRAAVERKRFVIEERAWKSWRKAERAARRKVWEPLARWTRRMRRLKVFWTQAVPRAIAESGGKFRKRTVRFLGFLGKVVPHAIFFYCAKVVVTRAVPTVLRVSVLRTRYCFASVGFLYPIFMTLTALEGDRLEEAENDEYDAGDGENADAKAKEQEEEIEKWARYWVAIGPLALLADVPFLSTSVSLFWPSWLEMCCVFVLWLEMPLMNGAYFTVDTVFAPMYKRFASARRRRRREKKRRGEMNMKSSGSASSLSMMMASALRSDVDEETDADYAEEDGVFYEDDDDRSEDSIDHESRDDDDDDDDDDNDKQARNKSIKYKKKKKKRIEEDAEDMLNSSSSESAASESSLRLFSSRKKRRGDKYDEDYTGELRRRRRHRLSQGELPPLPPTRVERKQRRARRKLTTKNRGGGLVGYRNALTRKLRDASKRVIIVWLRACVSIIGMFSPRLGEISRVALENTTGALLVCSLFFLVPGMFCRYGCAIAGVFVPCLKSLETITSSSSNSSTKAAINTSLVNGKMQNTFFLITNERAPNTGDGEGNKEEERTRTRITTSRTEKLRAQLQYWVAWSLLWSLAREIGWFPLARHLELAGIYWLQVFGGADVVSKKVTHVKDSIVSEHRNYFHEHLRDEEDEDLDKIIEIEEIEIDKEEEKGGGGGGDDDDDDDDDETLEEKTTSAAAAIVSTTTPEFTPP